MTHEELCERARRWLSGSRKCEPVFSNIASCSEIPDAIGWSSCYKWSGSTVIECKASVSDFHADKKKRIDWRDPRFGFRYPGSRISEKEAAVGGYERIDLPMMGDFRFYMCRENLLSAELIEKYAADHGLLYVSGKRIKVVREAPRRTLVDKDGEIRYLRFAIINGKEPYIPTETGRVGLFDGIEQAQASAGRDPQRTLPEVPTVESKRVGESEG